jgi:hypothetical protein
MRRKGELSPSAIDHGWPYQVAVKDDDGQHLGHIPSIGPMSSLCGRGHTVTDGQHRYRVFCFSDQAQAERFRDLMSGADLDPRDRSGGMWHRGREAARDARRRR